MIWKNFRETACALAEVRHYGAAVRVAGWSSPVARQAHNLKVPGSNPGPATNLPCPNRQGFVVEGYRVYVIQNSEGRFYIGLSENVETRLIQHNAGVSTWTRGRGPWSLVWTSSGMTLKDARQLEKLLKGQKGGDGFFRMTGLKRSGA
jgi:predicted GIY-YIG superfamily endonuclease